MKRKCTVYFKEEITYAVENEVQNNTESKVIIELARKKLEDDGRESYSVDTSGLKLENLDEEE